MANGKQGIAEIMARKTGSTRKPALEMARAFTEAVAEKLAEGSQVKLFGFGTFAVRERKSRRGRNPATGESLSIPAGKVPVFKAGPKLKHGINTGSGEGCAAGEDQVEPAAVQPAGR